MGETVHRGASYPGEHEAIVTKSLWERVQQVFAHGAARKKGQETCEVKSLLRGIIRCGHCDKSMIGTYTKKKGKVYRYYTCGGAMKNGHASCPVKSVPAGEIEKAVIGQLRVLLRSPEVIAQTFRAAQELEARELDALREEKSALEVRLVELKAWAGALVTSDADNETPSERFTELNDQIREARQQLRNVETRVATLSDQSLSEQDVAEALRKLDPVWDELFPSEQHRVFKSLVESAIVTTNGLDIRLRADGIHSIIAELKGSEEGVRAA